MLRGANKVTVDAKGRVAIPTCYRDYLAERSDGRLVITIDTDYCLLIYPSPDWQEIERKLNRLPSFNPRSRRLQRLMVGYASDVDLDGNGRVLLPKALREFANIDKHAFLIGQGNKFELWDEELWNKRRDEWLDGEDTGGLPAELESLSI